MAVTLGINVPAGRWLRNEIFCCSQHFLIFFILFRLVFLSMTIIVNSTNIRHSHIPAIIRNNQTGIIHCMQIMIHGFRKTLLLLIPLDIRNAPAFINRNPGDNARMIIIPLHNLRPVFQSAIHSFPVIHGGGCTLTPYQKAQLVRPVQKSGFFYLLVLPAAVKPHCLGNLNVLYQRFIIRCCQKSLGPISLV